MYTHHMHAYRPWLLFRQVVLARIYAHTHTTHARTLTLIIMFCQVVLARILAQAYHIRTHARRKHTDRDHYAWPGRLC